MLSAVSCSQEMDNRNSKAMSHVSPSLPGRNISEGLSPVLSQTRRERILGTDCHLEGGREWAAAQVL